jgi:cytochrome c oxidase subunit IV
MISTKVYFTVFAALLVLTALTTGVAFLNVGGIGNVAIAITIAVVKAVLVMLYFMHLRYSSYLTLLFAGAGIFWLGILIVLTVSDYVSRGWVSSFEAVLG